MTNDQLLTPKAPTKWVFLNKPDTRHDKNGKYRVHLMFDQADDFVTEIEEMAQASFKDLKKGLKPAQAKRLEYRSPVIYEVDEDGDEETGNVLLHFFTNAVIKRDDKIRPIKLKVFDAKGQPVLQLPSIGSGSIMRIAYKPKGQIVSGKFFLSLYMNAIQIIELREFMADGGSYGFGEEEGGFEAPAEDTFSADESASDEEVNDGEF